MNTLRLVVVILLLTLWGCASWQRVDQSRTEAPDKSYRVDLPLGWVRFVQESDAIVVTRDGLPLNRIRIVRRDLAKAFPLLKKAAQPDMLPSELAELQIAEAKTAEKDSVVIVRDNAPALIDGQVGFRLHLQQKNERGLVIDQVIYGLATARGYFSLSFSAPALHYTARDLPVFEQMVASFRLSSR